MSKIIKYKFFFRQSSSNSGERNEHIRTIQFEELLQHFVDVQAQHREAKRRHLYQGYVAGFMWPHLVDCNLGVAEISTSTRDMWPALCDHQLVDCNLGVAAISRQHSLTNLKSYTFPVNLIKSYEKMLFSFDIFIILLC